VGDFFRAVSIGFERGRSEILILGGALLVLLVGLSIYAWVRNRREKQRLAARRRELFERNAEAHDLTSEDRKLVSRLAQFLPEPGKSYLLLQNQHVFNACAREAVGRGSEELEHQISAIRVKLGFTSKRVDAPPKSSAELPPEAGVFIEPADGERIEAVVKKPSHERFRVEAEKPVDWNRGAEVTVYYSNAAGVFRFETSFRESHGNLLFFSHSEQIEQQQQRESFRRELHLPVYVYSEKLPDKHAETHFEDLSGGGAAIDNPEKQLGKGDEVELSFSRNASGQLNVSASVVRTSQSGQVAHLKFHDLREGDRDRIYRVVFQAE
jgi:hypothetical protein